MTKQREKSAANPPFAAWVEQRCGTCKSWHRRSNYACRHNGPYGGGERLIDKGCVWKPKVPNVQTDSQADLGGQVKDKQ